MKRLVLMVGLLWGAPAGAENEKSIGPYSGALWHYMALNWICRDEIGIASYQASRTIAVEGLAEYVGRDKAVLYVDEMDQKFRADPRRPKITEAECYERKADAAHQISVEKAKLEAE